MIGGVYILCAVTSLICAILLLRKFAKTRVQLLLWSGLCFVCLTINNAALYTDLVLIPDRDLSLHREIPALIGLALLLYGMIFKIGR
jgi:hypothetical protein